MGLGFGAVSVVVGICAAASMLAFAGKREEPSHPVSDLPAVADLPANPSLPDPLVMFDGRPVKNRKQWENERRPEAQAWVQEQKHKRDEKP